MGCFGCFSPEVDEDLKPSKPNYHSSDESSGTDARRKVAPLATDGGNGYAHSFTFKDLSVATGYFNEANFIGEGGFGKVYKGKINGQMVAVKQLTRDGVQGRNEFLVEVLMLTVLNHPHLVSLVGFCAQGDERLLVYEYMPFGSLESHLFDVPLGKQPLDWNTRMRIAVGVAEGLSYLHNVADPPIIYRDMKAANILLDEDYRPKLSDFGLAKVGPVGDRTHVSTRVMGTYGYCAPDYVVSGKLTMKSDIYSFGVLLLELITGRRIYDASRPKPEQSLLTWSRPFLHDKRKFHRLADPALHGCYPTSALNQLVVISIMCLQDQPHVRPIISDVVIGLNHVASQPYVPERSSVSLSSPARCGSPQYAGTPSRRRAGRRFLNSVVSVHSIISCALLGQQPSDIHQPGLEAWEQSADEKPAAAAVSGGGGGGGGREEYRRWPSGGGETGRVLDAPRLRVFTLAELRAVTRGFKPEMVLGEGGFGTVYKGWADERTLNPAKSSAGVVVAVKKLNPESVQGLHEWQSEVNFLGRLVHPNLVKLLGYCKEERELLLVYEFMPKGSLENHLFRRGAFDPLSWSLRLKIAIGAARGLAFLHSSERQIIYRDFKASNILLDVDYTPKLSDFGLAKNGPVAGRSHVTTRIIGTYGYAAPEYVATGHLYVKSDVYCFGVVLLELLTGLRAHDLNRPSHQQNLVEWARPYIAGGKKLAGLMDPRLAGDYPPKAAARAAKLADKCLCGDPKSRPSMDDVVVALQEIESMGTARPPAAKLPPRAPPAAAHRSPHRNPYSKPR
uniref:non-specific serine/threonine protein kinase n=1 Tax=Oryza punctata TaxID=4537 RepID=A0A0E0K8C3_ORYPU